MTLNVCYAVQNNNGRIPGINDQVGGNAHGDSDIGVYLFFCVILRTVYDSPV